MLPFPQIYFRRHCVVQYFLDQYDHILVIDSDVGIVNPHRSEFLYASEMFFFFFFEKIFLHRNNYVAGLSPLHASECACAFAYMRVCTSVHFRAYI